MIYELLFFAALAGAWALARGIWASGARWGVLLALALAIWGGHGG